MSMMWVGIGTAVLGAGTSLYGANKQAKSQASANDQNAASVRESDLNAWKSYLMQRGLDPSGVTTFGEVPTNARAQNVRAPLWMNMTLPGQAPAAGTSMVRRRAAGAQAVAPTQPQPMQPGF